jgi:hypothetical protein
MTDHGESGFMYHTGDLANTLGVSRTSLLYYEQAGLVSPRRNPDTGMREYSDDDVFDLIGFSALNSIGLTARQVAASVGSGASLYDESSLEEYVAKVSSRVAYDEALRGSLDRMRAIRVRDRLGPEIAVERIERHIFVADGAQDGYLGFRTTPELRALIGYVPISGFGITFTFDDGTPNWLWGRTVPTRLAAVVGIEHHFPVQIGGCTCVSCIKRVETAHEVPSLDWFAPLYDAAKKTGRRIAGDPFVPYIFPPHPGTPFKLCLPLSDEG